MNEQDLLPSRKDRAPSVNNDAGKPIGIVSTERDIAERKTNEAELAAAQQLYRELFDNVNIGILRSTPGQQGGAPPR